MCNLPESQYFRLSGRCFMGYSGEKILQNVAEKFGSKGKSRTFALPFEKRVAVKARSS